MLLTWLLLIILAVIQAPALAAGGWVTFTHPQPPFAIQYPSDWVRITKLLQRIIAGFRPGR